MTLYRVTAQSLEVLSSGSTTTDTQAVLICHFDGSNGQTTTTDSSASAHSVLLGSSATLSTAQSKFGGASLLTTAIGNQHGIIQAGLTDFQFGSGQFTIEAWVYFTSHSGGNVYVVAGNYNGSSNLGWDFGQIAGSLAFYYSTTGTDNLNVGAAWTPTLNTWYHIAVDRDAANVLRVYLNGAVHASATVASALYASTANLYLGNDGNLGRGFPGHIDELRISKGVARYGGAFTAPTSAFSATIASTIPARVSAQSLEVLVSTYEQRIAKSVGYAVLQSAGDRIGLQKAQGYAVLDSSAVVSVRKSVAYAVLFDTTISTVDRRRTAQSLLS